jgi:hypothetical protein
MLAGADPGIFKGGGPTLSKKFHPKFFFLSPQLEKQKNNLKKNKNPKNFQIPISGLNKAYARLLGGRREGSLLCHTCCDTGPRFFRSHPKERLFRRLLQHT